MMFTLAQARRLEAHGFIESVGMVEQCDGDGAIIEGRREMRGWVLTDAGVLKLRQRWAVAQVEETR